MRMKMEKTVTPQERTVMAKLYDWRDKVGSREEEEEGGMMKDGIGSLFLIW